MNEALNQGAVSAGLARLSHRDVLLSFDIDWSCDNLMQTAVDWLLGIQPPSKSMVGTFSSNEFQALAANHIDRSLVENTCLLLYATTQAHIKKLGAAENGELEAGPCTLSEAAYLSGQKVVDSLDRALSPLSLAGMSKEALQATFLVIVAVTLSVGYTAKLSDSPPLPDAGLTSRPTTPLTLWEAMRHHICEMLSHHMILIASRLQFKFQHEFQKTLITSALNKWDKEGRFTWVEFESGSPESASPDPPSPGPALSFPFEGASPDPAVFIPSEDIFTDFPELWADLPQTNNGFFDGPASGFNDPTSSFVFDSFPQSTCYDMALASLNEPFPDTAQRSSQFFPFTGNQSPWDDNTGTLPLFPNDLTSYRTPPSSWCLDHSDRDHTPAPTNPPPDKPPSNTQQITTALPTPQQPKRKPTTLCDDLRAKAAAAAVRKAGACVRCQRRRLSCDLAQDSPVCSTCKSQKLKIDFWSRSPLPGVGSPHPPGPPPRGKRTAFTPGRRADIIAERKVCAACSRSKVQCSHADTVPVAVDRQLAEPDSGVMSWVLSSCVSGGNGE